MGLLTQVSIPLISGAGSGRGLRLKVVTQQRRMTGDGCDGGFEKVSARLDARELGSFDQAVV